MNNIILQDGKPVFVGKEDPNNPPVKPVGESSKIECEKCRAKVDYLLGDKPKVCEACYDEKKDMRESKSEEYDDSMEIK